MGDYGSVTVVVMVLSVMGFGSLLLSLAVTARPKVAPQVLTAYLELVERSAASRPGTGLGPVELEQVTAVLLRPVCPPRVPPTVEPSPLVAA
jgi:hypothetical protein